MDFVYDMAELIRRKAVHKLILNWDERVNLGEDERFKVFILTQDTFRGYDFQVRGDVYNGLMLCKQFDSYRDREQCCGRVARFKS